MEYIFYFSTIPLDTTSNLKSSTPCRKKLRNEQMLPHVDQSNLKVNCLVAFCIVILEFHGFEPSFLDFKSASKLLFLKEK